MQLAVEGITEPEDFKEYTYLKVASNAKNPIKGLSSAQKNMLGHNVIFISQPLHCRLLFIVCHCSFPP
jgi:hypothetical protein